MSGKKAYIFPGQGSQFPGMARSLYENNSAARELIDRSDSILGFSISKIMFEGSAEDLKATQVTQPAVFIHSCAALSSVENFAPDMVAGHSLGEFSALTAAGVLSFEDALRLVHLRATQMQLCCEKVPGTMAAVIGLTDERVERICSEVNGTVICANYNCEGQIVISGENEAVVRACAAAKEAGAKRALPLAVSGAFHSPLMEPARAALAVAIESTEFRKPHCPVYQNVSATAEEDPVRIKKNLLAQLTSPVRWTQSVKAMLADGATYFCEFGPGNVLQGLVRRIAAAESKEITATNIQNT